jgi:hypothetical protein
VASGELRTGAKELRTLVQLKGAQITSLLQKLCSSRPSPGLHEALLRDRAAPGSVSLRLSATVAAWQPGPAAPTRGKASIPPAVVIHAKQAWSLFFVFEWLFKGKLIRFLE